MIGTALVMNVAQIIEGEARCYCGEPADLVMTTEPDNEPGPVCSRHYLEWVDLACSPWSRPIRPQRGTGYR